MIIFAGHRLSRRGLPPSGDRAAYRVPKRARVADSREAVSDRYLVRSATAPATGRRQRMRPVRFVALSEDGQALVLADEVGRLLALPIDERVSTALRAEPRASGPAPAPATTPASDPPPTLSPRDIQARIRGGESAEDVARVAGVPVDRVLRYAGPVLQERAMLAQHARRTRLKTSDSGAPLAEVVDSRLAQHGIDTEKISWDAFRREDRSEERRV